MSETEKVMREIFAEFEGEYDWDNHQRTDCPYLTGTRLAECYMKGFKAARRGQHNPFGGETAKENAMADPKSKTLRNAWTIDIEKWFGLRKPSDEQAIKLDKIRAHYMHLANSILDLCPSNPDRTHAVRQLKESMHTAIGSIVCADTWGDLEAPDKEGNAT